MLVAKTIKLPNRYGDKNYLIPIDEFYIPNFKNIYKLELENPEFGITTSYKDDRKTICSIDPPGGPYMQVDHFNLYGYILRNITFRKGVGFVLEFYEQI